MIGMVYIPTEIWGEPLVFSTLDELEEAIIEVCERNPEDFVFPEDGLREGRDYIVEADTADDDYGDWAESPYAD